MSDSLQDQLLALGLAKEKPRPASSKRKHKARKQKGSKDQRDNKANALMGREISLDAAYRARQQDDKSSAEKARAEKRALDLERRRLNTQIAALLKDQTLNDRAGELKRNFLYKGKIRSVRVNQAQLEALNSGALALVFLRGDYLVVQPELAEQVRQLSAEHIPDLGSEAPDEKGFPVPDDLTW